jgi:hypothetical protein
MRPGRIAALIFGIIIALIAFALVVGGGALTWAHATQRDAQGFLTSPEYRLETPRHALASGAVDISVRPADWWPSDLLDVRFAVERADSQMVFVGIGSSADVAAYLSGVSYDEVTHLGRRTDVDYRPHEGGAPSGPPADQGFWVASAQGTGTQTVTWDVAQGSWTVVVMNADGGPGVAVDLEAGVRVAWLFPIALGLLIVGVVLGALAAALLVWAVGKERRPAEAAEAAPTPVGAMLEGAYPAAISGTIDPELSRGLWLIKWFLAIPHYVCLAFLWAAFAILTVLAFFAILFTGRYPRGMFEFNVGVLRWTWRVGFYAFNPAGTDRYPPFTLDDTGYPARLEIAYPERLSRGLVLVKWWFLAIPHYLVVGVFTSGLVWWTQDSGGDGAFKAGGGLMTLLTLIALVVLLFGGRYPRGLFDLLMGLNRWVIRVAAYAALLRDEYPPFRLDMGGDDPTGLSSESAAPPGEFGHR